MHPERRIYRPPTAEDEDDIGFNGVYPDLSKPKVNFGELKAENKYSKGAPTFYLLADVSIDHWKVISCQEWMKRY